MGQREKSRKTRSVMVVSSGGDNEDEDKDGTVRVRVVERVEERRRERRVRVVEEEEKKGGGGIGDRGEAMRVEKTRLEGDVWERNWSRW